MKKAENYEINCCANCRETDGWYCLCLAREVDDDIDPCADVMPDCPYFGTYRGSDVTWF